MLDRHSSPLLIKATASDAGEFEGYASTFNGPVDSQGDIIFPGAFSKSIERFKAEGRRPSLLWIHDWDEPVGVWHELAEDDHGLRVRGKFALGAARGRDAHALAREGALALSIGYRVPAGGKSRNEYGGFDLREIHLAEISVVPMPSNPAARITAVKSAALRSHVDFQKALREHLGLSDREAKRAAAGGWSSLTRQAEPTLDEAELSKRLRLITRTLTLR